MHDDIPATLTPVDDDQLAAIVGGSVLGDLWDHVIEPDLRAVRDAVRAISEQLFQ